MELESLAISTVNKYLAQGTYHQGERILVRVVQKWAMQHSTGKFTRSPTFEFRSQLLQNPKLEKPPIQDITSLVIYEHANKYENILWGLSREWIFRALEYYDQSPADIKTAAIRGGTKTARKPWEIVYSIWPERAILRILSDQQLNDGLDFLAMVFVQWAFRFDPTGFVDWVGSLGWPILDDMPREDFITQCALLFPAMAFQMEASVPIYWALIDAREKGKAS